MLKLIFKIDVTGNLELTLAAARYERFWQTHRLEILDTFKRHTGLRFSQQQITVKITEGRMSTAGNRFDAMQLTRLRVDEELVAVVLLHELAHRLVMGNYIGSQASNYVYHDHCYIDLFLYDAWTDILGKAAADRAIAAERNNGFPAYAKAWDWAMAKTYAERQQYLQKLIKSKTK